MMISVERGGDVVFSMSVSDDESATMLKRSGFQDLKFDDALFLLQQRDLYLIVFAAAIVIACITTFASRMHTVWQALCKFDAQHGTSTMTPLTAEKRSVRKPRYPNMAKLWAVVGVIIISFATKKMKLPLGIDILRQHLPYLNLFLYTLYTFRRFECGQGFLLRGQPSAFEVLRQRSGDPIVRATGDRKPAPYRLAALAIVAVLLLAQRIFGIQQAVMIVVAAYALAILPLFSDKHGIWFTTHQLPRYPLYILCASSALAGIGMTIESLTWNSRVEQAWSKSARTGETVTVTMFPVLSTELINKLMADPISDQTCAVLWIFVFINSSGNLVTELLGLAYRFDMQHLAGNTDAQTNLDKMVAKSPSSQPVSLALAANMTPSFFRLPTFTASLVTLVAFSPVAKFLVENVSADTSYSGKVFNTTSIVCYLYVMVMSAAMLIAAQIASPTGARGLLAYKEEWGPPADWRRAASVP